MTDALSVHGHDAMAVMAALPGRSTREAVEAALRDRFGPDVRFHTCSASGMTAGALIDFLQARGKLVSSPDGGLTLAAGGACRHD